MTTGSREPESLCGLDALDELLAKAGGENFPVASRLLPPRYRRHLLAVYGFARLVDDIGDEAPPAQRLRLLDRLEDDVDRIYEGVPQLPATRALRDTVQACAIPPEPFLRLIEANRQDQRVSRYATFEELLGYCELSANPVGHIVLYIFDAATPERLRLADRVCTALQLVEHWQDVAEDYGRGRVYLPQEDLERFGVAERDLAAPSAGARLRRLIAFETRRAARFLDEGSPLVATLSGFPRLATAGYVAGGRAALAAIEAAGWDVLRATPRPRHARLLRETLRAFTVGS
ncbi:MAG: squalene synthase HpnC [Sphaerobacter sp.]|nr:squalene synthase HpnC [Sphaerobacter sp.]